MKKLFFSFVTLALILGGCNFQKKEETVVTDEYKIPSEEEQQEMHNDLLSDPTVLKDDELLMAGDTGLQGKFKKVQNDPSENDSLMLQKMNTNDEMNNGLVNIANTGTTLHQTFVNPKIKPINGSYINNVIGKGWDYYGRPYQLGSSRKTDTTFDCSDFTRWIHLVTLGMDLPMTSQTQWNYVKAFSKHKYTDLSQAKKGDLLFFMNYRGYRSQDYAGINVKAQPVGHCGIYLGNGKILHTASQKTGGVRFDTIKGSHLEYRFIGGGKVIQ